MGPAHITCSPIYNTSHKDCEKCSEMEPEITGVSMNNSNFKNLFRILGEAMDIVDV